MLALRAVALGWVLISRHIVGFQVMVIGMAPLAGAFAGYKEKRLIWITLLISGGCAGLAGVIELSGAIGQIVPSLCVETQVVIHKPENAETLKLRDHVGGAREGSSAEQRRAA